MRRYIAFIFVVLMCVCSFCSCEAKRELTAEPYTIPFEKTVSFTPTGAENGTGGIVARERKYTYLETDLMILQVENSTDKAYAVTISGTFYDENGEELGTASKTFEEFASGHQRYFLFRPGFVFDRFDYTVETAKHSSDCPASLLTAEFVGLKDGYAPGSNGAKTQLSILGGLVLKNESDVVLDIGVQYLILFDEKGEIFSISPSGTKQNIEPDGDEENEPLYSFLVYQQAEKISEWPEAIRENARGIIVVEDVTRSKFN